MKRRIRIAGATLVVAAGLVGAVAAPASAAGPPPGKGLEDFGTFDCEGVPVDLVGPVGGKAASGWNAETGKHLISFSLHVSGIFDGEPFEFSKTYGQKSGLTPPLTCTQSFVDSQTNVTATLVVGLAPSQ